ncbi:hypothetical protein ACH5RR_041692 [Cinchona calisaya]|uniref:DUF7722 domain-containing protein n=1 Tax=Cinchona calisaya TaxID=153742 RepID=A0ABD2XY99_9GENT
MSGTTCPPNSAHNIPSLMQSNGHHNNQQLATRNNNKCSCAFQMPLHYPRFKKSDYEKMPEPQLDCLLKEYGLPTIGDLNEKRKFAMGAFLWPDEY